ncbi:MAG TPA: aminodeoxychorismate/anthranilate synthase component II [Pyrinomonadaceae bacterium]
MILVIDNYDSFTYNLVQYLGELGADVIVRRNDQLSIEDVATQLRPDRIVISPGPGVPDNAGMTLALIENFAGKLPILGVCLGHQAIGQHFGGRVVRAGSCVHGKASEVSNDGRTIFAGVRSPFSAGRYHSLVLDPESLPACLEVSAVTTDGVIMGIRHRELKVEGVQFHPESILTTAGKRLLDNFLNL